MQKTWVQFLGQEDALEREKATHSSILVWEIPWTEEPGGLRSMGLQKSQTRFMDWTHVLSTVMDDQACEQEAAYAPGTRI